MTVSTSWQIEIGTKGSFTDFTSRTNGFQIYQTLERGALGTGRAQIEMLNNDGELTPNIGNTYSNVDWFAQIVRISATVSDGTSSETVPVFTGIIDDFNVLDNGTNSVAQFTTLDFMSVSGRSNVRSGIASQTYVTGATAFANVYNSGGGFPPIGLASYGGTDPLVLVVSINTPELINYKVDFDAVTAGEQVNNQIMVHGPLYAWPTQLIFDDEPDGIFDPDYQVMFSDRKLNRTSVTEYQKRVGRTFVFKNSPTTTELPVNDISAGYTQKDMRNAASVTGNQLGATVQTAESPVSIDKYGTDSVNFSEMAANTDSDAADTASLWATRWNDIAYSASQITIKASTVAERCANAAWQSWADLLDIRSGLLNVAEVEYQPTGASTAITDACVLWAREIKATPSDTIIRCTLKPAANYQSFVLDSDTLGVLDTNRLG